MTGRSWLQHRLKRQALTAALPLLIATALVLGVMASAATGRSPASSRVVSYVYKLNYRGEAEVTVIVNAAGLSKVSVRLERGYVRGSLTAYSENGTPLYCNVSDDVATVYTYNLTKTVILEYVAVLGNVSNEVLVNVTIHPLTKASVFLPRGTAVTYVSGNPDVEFMNGTIALIYAHGGTYRIDYVIIPPSVTKTGSTATPAPPTSGTPAAGATSASAAETPTRITRSTAGASGVETSLSTSPYLWAGIAAAGIAGAAAAYAYRRVRGSAGVEGVEIASGLDDRDMKILESLSGGELSLSEIARKVGLNKSVVWRRVNRMMREGYLERRVAKGRTLYRLTAKGLKAVAGEGDA